LFDSNTTTPTILVGSTTGKAGKHAVDQDQLETSGELDT
jgi:hypothetical protein